MDNLKVEVKGEVTIEVNNNIKKEKEKKTTVIINREKKIKVTD